MSTATKERAAFANWLARQHLSLDPRLTQIVYLPTDAPEDEVRLIEVNTGLYREPGETIIPLDTTPAVVDLPFRVLIVDITPEEWEQVRANATLLPKGWRLDGYSVTRRAQ